MRLRTETLTDIDRLGSVNCAMDNIIIIKLMTVIPKEYIEIVRIRGILWSFTEITPAKLNRSGRNLTGKRGLRWDARLENFDALRPTAARRRQKTENFLSGQQRVL